MTVHRGDILCVAERNTAQNCIKLPARPTKGFQIMSVGVGRVSVGAVGMSVSHSAGTCQATCLVWAPGAGQEEVRPP